jgi:hypothetical protein
MGLIVLHSTIDDLCYQIILTKTDSNNEVIKYLDECGFQIENPEDHKLDYRMDRALKMRTEIPGGHAEDDVVYKFTIGCKIPALSLIYSFRTELGYDLKQMSTSGNDGSITYLLCK